MKKTLFFTIALLLASCTARHVRPNDVIQPETENTGLQASYSDIAVALSRAVFKEQQLRCFIKQEALKKFGTDYDVFYPLLKDTEVSEKETFAAILNKYASEETPDLRRNYPPLLNIHCPNYFPVSQWDTANDSVVGIICNDVLYVNGEIVDTLDYTKIPAIRVLSLDDSEKITIARTTRANDPLRINDKYAFSDRIFAPHQSINLRSTTQYDSKNPRYDEEGLLPLSEIESHLINTYNLTKWKKQATRFWFNYGITSQYSTSVRIPQTPREDVHECLYRIKLNPTSFQSIREIAESKVSNNDTRIIDPECSRKTHPLSREDIFRRMLTGRTITINIRVFSLTKDGRQSTREMRIRATPEKLFNLAIHQGYRKPSFWKRSKYFYSLDIPKIKSKWFYPTDYGMDTRLFRWDLEKLPTSFYVSIFVENEDLPETEEVTETYQFNYMSKSGIGLKLGINPSGNTNFNLNFNQNNDQSYQKNYTTKYTLKRKFRNLGTTSIDYYKDYPIEEVLSNRTVVLGRVGTEAVEMSFIPMSQRFYNFMHVKNK